MTNTAAITPLKAWHGEARGAAKCRPICFCGAGEGANPRVWQNCETKVRRALEPRICRGWPDRPCEIVILTNEGLAKIGQKGVARLGPQIAGAEFCLAT